MAFPYVNALADYSAQFPSQVMALNEFRNASLDGYEVADELFYTPADPDTEGRYRMNLDLVPLDLPGLTVEVDGDPRTVIPYGEAPAAGEVAVSFETGVIEFHSSDAEQEAVANYTGGATPAMAYHFVKLMKEVAANQSRTLQNLLGAASSIDNAITRFDGTGGKTAQNSTVTLSDTGVIQPTVDTAMTLGSEDNRAARLWVSDGVSLSGAMRTSNIVIASTTISALSGFAGSTHTVNLTGLTNKRRALIGFFPASTSDADIRKLDFRTLIGPGNGDQSDAAPVLDSTTFEWNGLAIGRTHDVEALGAGSKYFGQRFSQLVLVFEDLNRCTRPRVHKNEMYGLYGSGGSVPRYAFCYYALPAGVPLFGIYYGQGGSTGLFGASSGAPGTTGWAQVQLQTMWLSGTTPTLNMRLVNNSGNATGTTFSFKVAAFEQ